MRTFVLLILLFLLFFGCKTHNEKNEKLSNKDKVVALLKSFETGDRKAISFINPDKYIQHNLGAADGIEGLQGLLKILPKDTKADIKRIFADGDYVIVHSAFNFFGPKAVFDIFRFENEKIVEHWDNISVMATKPNSSGHTEFDGAVAITDLDKTEANKILVTNFVRDVLAGGQFDLMDTYLNGESYIQHNTLIADGVIALKKAFEEFKAKNIIVYEKIHQVLGEGNFVLVVGEGKLSGKSVAYYDLFRVADGKITEHWDVIEEIPPQDQWKNSNGKF